MYKGITLLETLIVLFILSVTLTFTLPKWQKNDPQYFLEKEQQRLYFFLRNIHIFFVTLRQQKLVEPTSFNELFSTLWQKW